MSKNNELQIRKLGFFISVPAVCFAIAAQFSGATGVAGIFFLCVILGLWYLAVRVLWRVWMGEW